MLGIAEFVLSFSGRRLQEEGEVMGYETHAFTREHEVMLAEYLLVFLLLLAGVLMLQYFIGKVWHLHYLPESGATMLVGMLISLFIRASGKDSSGDSGVGVLGFSSTVFFLGFLPPIIYNSGYQLERRLFFANLGGVMSLAVIGTTISAIIVGLALWGLGSGGASYKMTFMEALCFGSLISATDPVSTLAVFTELRVDPTLFYLVFGESVMNDAVAITLFRTTAKFVGISMTAADFFIAITDFIISLVGSTIIGYILGLGAAYVFKVVDMSHHRVTNVAVFVCMTYVPFFLCETFQLSGIVAILFSAITAKRYANVNITQSARRACAFVFELMAYMAETSVFLYLGMDVFSKSKANKYRFDVVFWCLFFCIVARAIHVYPILHFVNNYRTKRALEKNRRPNLIPENTKHMVFFAGLRGAVAYACANIFPDTLGSRDVIITSTMVIALLTIFINGGLTMKALQYLGIPIGVDFKPYVESLKKVAKPYKFLIWEQKYIYPYVIRDYRGEVDISIHDDDGHLGTSNHAGGHGGAGHGGHGNGTAAHGEEGDIESPHPANGHNAVSTEEISATISPVHHVPNSFDNDNESDEGNVNTDGLQLSKGYQNSSGGSVPLSQQDNDSLW